MSAETMIAPNESAPAEVEDSTGAALGSASGDGHPLRAAYTLPPLPVNGGRTITYIAIDTGEASTYVVRKDLTPPLVRAPLCKKDVRPIRILAHCDPALPKVPNSVLAAAALNAIKQVGTAKHVPVLVVTALLDRVDFTVHVDASPFLEDIWIAHLHQLLRIDVIAAGGDPSDIQVPSRVPA